MSILSKIKDAVAGTRDQLEDIRRKIADGKAERDSVRRAPLSKPEALGQIDALIAGAANRFEADAAFPYLARTCTNIGLVFEVALRGRDSMIYALAWLDPDRLRERMTQQLHKFWEQNPPGLPSSERRQRIAALDAEILKLEAQEEAIIVAAAEHGIALGRRGDADPRVVIGTADDEKPAA